LRSYSFKLVLFICQLALVSCCFLGQIVSQAIWLPAKAPNVSEEDYSMHCILIKAGFKELELNEKRYTLNNIAASYAKLSSPSDTVFKYLNLGLVHFPHDECLTLFDSIEHNSFVKSVENTYSTSSSSKWKQVKLFCDSILSSYNREVQELLLAMEDDDQKIRDRLDDMYGSRQFDPSNHAAMKLWDIQEKKDSLNQLKLDRIVNNFGFPGKSLVGSKLSNVAISIILHGNLEFQEKYSEIVKKFIELNELDKANYPYLMDRILMGKGQKQMYGTQFSYDEKLKKVSLYPIEDPIRIDERRAAYHLLPLKYDIEFYNSIYERFGK